MKKLHAGNRIAAIVLTLALALSCFCIAPAASAVQTGDVNGDGEISVIDAILVQKMSLGMIA